MPRDSLVAHLVCVLMLWELGPLAQTAPPAKNQATQVRPAATSTKPTSPPKPKLTPEQERGLRLLKTAEAEAGALEPAMRASVLWQAEAGMSKLDRDQGMALLRDAFRASVEAPDDNADLKCFMTPDMCHSKPWLQQLILEDMIEKSPPDAERLLPQAESGVRVFLTGQLISKYVRDKKLDHAEQVLRSVSDQDNFPYQAATELMLAESKPTERISVFRVATDNYRTFGDGKSQWIDEDLATLVIRFWQDLPAPDVLSAIDMILEQAKGLPANDEKDHLSYTTNQGSVTLSFYQYRLFELLPVLDELDSAKADRLRQEQAQVASALQKYPHGLQSLNPWLRNTPLSEKEQEEQMRQGDYPAISSGMSPAQAAQDQAEEQLQRQLEEKQLLAHEQAATDPKQALETAMSLPLWYGKPGFHSPRANTLMTVARIAGKRDPDVSQKAIEEVGKMLDQAQPALAGRLTTGIVKAYLSFDDKDHAEKALADGMKVARKVYEKDIDSSDPNLALRASWPSSALWRALIMLGAQISPAVAERLIAEVPDEGIRSFQEVSFANSLLGAQGLFRGIEWRRSGHDGMYSF